jgi:hypothetical protein
LHEFKPLGWFFVFSHGRYSALIRVDIQPLFSVRVLRGEEGRARKALLTNLPEVGFEQGSLGALSGAWRDEPAAAAKAADSKTGSLRYSSRAFRG